MARNERGLLPEERRAVVGLAGILSLRMLGYYALLPILSAYAAELPGANELRIGMTVGIYGLTQAIFQIPMGVMSDRSGRRRAICLGLIVFAGGSFIAGAARTIWPLLLGRFVQGAGAVASVLIALAADLTRPVARTRGMAFLGLAIGLSFGVGFVLGPPAAEHFGVSTLFYVTGVLSLVAAVYVLVGVKPVAVSSSGRITWADIVRVSRRRELSILNLGTLAVHFCLTCIFVVVPLALENHLPRSTLWRIYLPMIVPALFLMFLAARRADHPGWSRPVLWCGSGLLAVGCGYIALFPLQTVPTITIAIVLFTWGVALTEPILPALLTRFAPSELRGTAAGVFNMCQFTGAFLGGLVGSIPLRSLLHPGSDPIAVRLTFLGMSVAFLAWTALAFRLPNPFRVEIARRREHRRAGLAQAKSPAD